jgi:uncharacterized Zn-finger protein
METASSALGARLHHQLRSQSPFDPYRDPFDSASRHDRGNNAESWSSGDNSTSPLPAGMNGSANMESGLHGIQTDDGLGPIEGKKKRFVCPHCTRTFARSGHLQRHERSRMSF